MLPVADERTACPCPQGRNEGGLGPGAAVLTVFPSCVFYPAPTGTASQLYPVHRILTGDPNDHWALASRLCAVRLSEVGQSVQQPCTHPPPPRILLVTVGANTGRPFGLLQCYGLMGLWRRSLRCQLGCSYIPVCTMYSTVPVACTSMSRCKPRAAVSCSIEDILVAATSQMR